MPFQIIRNDITQVRADAIVNTANPQPVVGSGTDWAIHNAAGPELLEARKKIGRIPAGQAAATPAFRLPARYVLHTVSPAWIDGAHQEEALLRKAYDAALALAESYRSAARGTEDDRRCLLEEFTRQSDYAACLLRQRILACFA